MASAQRHSVAPESRPGGKRCERGLCGSFVDRGVPCVCDCCDQCLPGGRWITVGGWALLASTAAFLAWEEVTDFHISRTRVFGDEMFGMANSQHLWPVLLSPLIVAFIAAMWIFVHKGLQARAVRAPLILGVTAWMLAVVNEAIYLALFSGRAETLGTMLEETLEFSGTLLIGLSAGIALWSVAVAQPRSHLFSGTRLFLPVVGSMVTVAVFGGLTIAFVLRAPLADTRLLSRIGAFHVSLHDERSAVQELGVLSAPLARLDLRISNRDPDGRSGTVMWRIVEAGEGSPSLILRAGRMKVPAGEHPRWGSIVFPPLAEAEERPLAVQLVADVAREAHLRVGATKTNQHEDRQPWITGIMAWPDQNLEFVLYSATEPTRSKFHGLWRMFTSDWRWPVLATDLAIALTLITLVPALLVTAALSRRIESHTS